MEGSLDGVMRLVNFHLGGSLYIVAAVAAAGGPFRMCLLLLACALLTLAVYEALADLAVRRGSGSLCRLVSSTLGRGPALALRALVVLNALGVIVAYLQACIDIYQSVAVPTASPQALASFGLTVAGGCLLTLALEQLLPSMADWGSLMANGALLVLLAALWWQPAAPALAASGAEEKPWLALVIAHGPALVFAFSSAEYVLLACGTCDSNGNLLPGVDVHRQVRFVGAISLALSLALYAAVGLGGVHAFGSQVQEDVLKNFQLDGSDRDLLSALVLGSNAVSLLLSLPVFAETLLLYLRELLHECLDDKLFTRFEECALGSMLVNPSHPYVACAWVIPCAALVARHFTGLLGIIDLMSSCTDYGFMFVFPGMVFCMTFSVWECTLRWIFYCLLALGACCMAVPSFLEALNKMV